MAQSKHDNLQKQPLTKVIETFLDGGDITIWDVFYRTGKDIFWDSAHSMSADEHSDLTRVLSVLKAKKELSPREKLLLGADLSTPTKDREAYLQSAAEQGLAVAFTLLAELTFEPFSESVLVIPYQLVRAVEEREICGTYSKNKHALKAVDYLNKAIRLGDARAYTLLGYFYLIGFGVSTNLFKAKEYTLKGVELKAVCADDFLKLVLSAAETVYLLAKDGTIFLTHRDSYKGSDIAIIYRRCLEINEGLNENIMQSFELLLADTNSLLAQMFSNKDNFIVKFHYAKTKDDTLKTLLLRELAEKDLKHYHELEAQEKNPGGSERSSSYAVMKKELGADELKKDAVEEKETKTSHKPLFVGLLTPLLQARSALNGYGLVSEWDQNKIKLD